MPTAAGLQQAAGRIGAVGEATVITSNEQLEDLRNGEDVLSDLPPGMEMVLSHPLNLFPLDLLARKHLMIAGGIGITPLQARHQIGVAISGSKGQQNW